MPDETIVREIIRVTSRLFNKFIEEFGSFKVLDDKIVPEGLRPHTRSICWLAEQVILQNIKANAGKLGIKNFNYPPSDISVWDCKFSFKNLHPDQTIFVNVKVTDVTKPERKNDFASVKTLLDFFNTHKDPLLLCVIVKLRFENTLISFVPPPLIKNYVWIDSFVVNPRNEHLQAVYNCGEIVRTANEFVRLIIKKAREKRLDV